MPRKHFWEKPESLVIRMNECETEVGWKHKKIPQLFLEGKGMKQVVEEIILRICIIIEEEIHAVLRSLTHFQWRFVASSAGGRLLCCNPSALLSDCAFVYLQYESKKSRSTILPQFCNFTPNTDVCATWKLWQEPFHKVLHRCTLRGVSITRCCFFFLYSPAGQRKASLPAVKNESI